MNYTIPELNEWAARLWMPNNRVTVADDGRAIVGGNYFDPARSPADCAVAKRVMREKGWRLYVEDETDHYYAAFLTGRDYAPSDTVGWADAPTEEHAVTLAAVRAWEGGASGAVNARNRKGVGWESCNDRRARWGSDR